jgi:glycosyltransferase involved in cell wall biosynthesis
VKILHYHRLMQLETGGVVRAVLDMCAGLADAGHDVTLITCYGEDLPESWINHEAGVPRAIVIDPPSVPGGFFTPSAMEAIGRHIAEADVLHLHSMWAQSNIQFAKAARKRGVPYVYSVHGMLDDWCMDQRGLKKRVYLSLFGREMLHGAHAVHCTAEAELEQAKKWFPKGRGAVIPLIFDTSPFRDMPGPGPALAKFPQIDDGKPRLLFLSRIHYKKGIELLIDATAELAEQGRECLALIVGSGEADYERQLRRRVAERGLDERVLFLGFVSGVEKISMYEAADLFVLPTSQENFGFVLFEALAAGTPVITTRGADTWPEMEESGGAVVVAPDATTIAEAAAALLDDEPRRAEMGRSGRDWVLSALSAESVVRRYEELYEEAARR